MCISFNFGRSFLFFFIHLFLLTFFLFIVLFYYIWRQRQAKKKSAYNTLFHFFFFSFAFRYEYLINYNVLKTTKNIKMCGSMSCYILLCVICKSNASMSMFVHVWRIYIYRSRMHLLSKSKNFWVEFVRLTMCACVCVCAHVVASYYLLHLRKYDGSVSCMVYKIHRFVHNFSFNINFVLYIFVYYMRLICWCWWLWL